MKIRRATVKDTERITALRRQVLTVHAELRPDIFIPETTKYTKKELEQMVADDANPIFVADDDGSVVGYAFCQIKEPEITNNTVPFRSLYIDDLCVDSEYRGRRIGTRLFEFVKEEARRLGCYEITLNVWEGNETAERFYEKLGMKPKKHLLELILE